MKKLVLLLPIALLAACGGDSSDKDLVDSTPKKDSVAVVDSVRPHSTVLDTIDPASERKVMEYSASDLQTAMKSIPEGWVLMDTMSGDLNRDQYKDLVMVLKRPDEDSGAGISERPVLVWIGTASKGLQLAARNDHVVLCKDCGGIWGDPYDGLAIKNGYFSVEHYGGSNWRWTKIITFKYSEKEKTWLLHRDAGVSYNSGDPEGTEEETAEHQDQYGKQKFVDYNYE